jgi:hypothetical protein
MYKTVLNLSVAALSLVGTTAGTASASTPQFASHHGSYSHSSSSHSSYSRPHVTYSRASHYHNWHVSHGVHFSHGYYFRGVEFRFFQYRHWDTHYRCWVFYYPEASCYYYWCGTDNCYYPISYATVVPPCGDLPTGIDVLPCQ